MAKYPIPLYLVIAMVAVVIIGSSVDVLDATFGTRMSAVSGIWFALAATVLFIAYLFYAFKAWKKR